MKFIIFLSLFVYAGFAKAFHGPQGGGIPTEVICAIAAQNAMTGKDPSQQERLSEEDLRDEKEAVQEDIRTTNRQISSLKGKLLGLLKEEIRCQYKQEIKTYDPEHDIMSNLIDHIGGQKSPPRRPSLECRERDFTISLQFSEEASFLLSQNLNPFFLIAPFPAQAQLLIAPSEGRPDPQFCCVEGQVKNAISGDCEDRMTTNSENMDCSSVSKGGRGPSSAGAEGDAEAGDAEAGAEASDGSAGDGNSGINDRAEDTEEIRNAAQARTCDDSDLESACDYWTYQQFFESDGHIKIGEFCNSSNIQEEFVDGDDCIHYLEQLKEEIDHLNGLKERKDDLRRQIRDEASLNRSCQRNPDQEHCGSSETEGQNWCTSCFNETIESFYPKKSGWEKLANFMLPAASLFFGYRGIRQNNEKLALAGFEPDNSAYTQLAYPYALSALYGSNQGAGPCSPSNSFNGYYSAAALLSGSLRGGNGFNNFFQRGHGNWNFHHSRGRGPFSFNNARGPFDFNTGIPGGGNFNNAGFPFSFDVNAGLPGVGIFNNTGIPGGGNFNNAGFPFSFDVNAGLPGVGIFNNTGIPGGGNFSNPWGSGNAQFNINYQAQMEAHNRARIAYMESLQVEQERNMAKMTAVQSLQQQMYQLQNQMRRVWTGYDTSGGHSYNPTGTVPPGTVPPGGGISGGVPSNYNY